MVAQARGRRCSPTGCGLPAWRFIGVWAVRGVAWWPFARRSSSGGAGLATWRPRRAASRPAAASPINGVLAIVLGLASSSRSPGGGRGPADRPRACSLRAVRPGSGVAGPSRRATGVHPADLGVVVRVGRARRASCSSTPGSSSSRRTSGPTTRDRAGRIGRRSRASGPTGRDAVVAPPGSATPGAGCRAREDGDGVVLASRRARQRRSALVPSEGRAGPIALLWSADRESDR